ncbi:MAG: putative membrane protein insertion efficiency factor [Phycisphaerae bacterium]|nr:putative membrane protein insertion efficiency factor [Phycisphaerae bacterium]
MHYLLVGMLVVVIQAYQYGLRPLLVGQCKFFPSCSHYAQEALQRHGIRRGGWLALKRLGRCHPFNTGGIDLVPDDWV